MAINCFKSGAFKIAVAQLNPRILADDIEPQLKAGIGVGQLTPYGMWST